MQTFSIPPPYGGIRDDVPLAVLESPYAEKIQNYNLDTGTAILRKGDKTWSSVPAQNVYLLNLATFGSGTSQKLISCYNNAGQMTWHDITAGGTGTLLRFTGFGADEEVQSLFYNGQLIYFSPTALAPAFSGPQAYNGTTFTGTSYTWGSLTVPFGGASYKERGYIMQYQNTFYGYTDIKALSGNLTIVDLKQVASYSGNILGIRPIALSEGIQQETVLSFLMESGEILVYSGSYPNSANWQLVGRFLMPAIVYTNTIVDARGDSFIITASGLFSLRTLFSKGAEVAIQTALSANIKNRWKQIFAALLPVGPRYFINGTYDPIRDRIIISFPKFVDRTGAINTNFTHRLIYSFKTNSWVEHIVTVPVAGQYSTGLTYFNNVTTEGVFYGGYYRGTYQMEGKSNYVDDQLNNSTAVGIQYQLTTAPIYNEHFGVNSTTGIELISKSDLYAQTNYKLVSNLGQSTTSSQQLPSQGTGIANPFINVGVDANYLQLDISGTTTSASTIGLELYAFNLWSEKGGVR